MCMCVLVRYMPVLSCCKLKEPTSNAMTLLIINYTHTNSYGHNAEIVFLSLPLNKNIFLSSRFWCLVCLAFVFVVGWFICLFSAIRNRSICRFYCYHHFCLLNDRMYLECVGYYAWIYLNFSIN